MALYYDKGTEELTGKLENFSRLFKEKTGTDLDPESLKSILHSIYESKKHQLITQAFGTETIPTLKTLIECFDEIFPRPQATVEITPEMIEAPNEEEPKHQGKKRKSK